MLKNLRMSFIDYVFGNGFFDSLSLEMAFGGYVNFLAYCLIL